MKKIIFALILILWASSVFGMQFTYFDDQQSAQVFADRVQAACRENPDKSAAARLVGLVVIKPYYLAWNNKYWVAVPFEVPNMPALILDTDAAPIQNGTDQ